MSMEILYECLHCLFYAVLAAWLIRRTVRLPRSPVRYAVSAGAVCIFLGDVYWLAHLLIRGGMPQMFSACDVAYVGMWLILGAGLPRAENRADRWFFPAFMGLFTALNAAGWMLWTGGWFSDLIWALSMLMVAVRGAMLVEVDVRSRMFRAFFMLVVLLIAAEWACLTLEGEGWQAAETACEALWLLSLAQFVWLLKGKQAFMQLSMPRLLLMMLYVEFASLMSTAWAYYVFQVLMMGAFYLMARAVCKEGTDHAI